jgi:hypothetical protein
MGFGAAGGAPGLYARLGAAGSAEASLLPLVGTAGGERQQGRYRLYLAALAEVRRLCEGCVAASRAQAEAVEPLLDAAHLALAQLEAAVPRLQV